MSENWGRCKYCKWCDPSERDGYKVFCERYGTYEDPDKTRECNNYDDR